MPPPLLSDRKYQTSFSVAPARKLVFLNVTTRWVKPVSGKTLSAASTGKGS